MEDFQLKGEKGRIDVILVDYLPELSRSNIQKMIQEQLILVNQQPTKANYKTIGNEHITILSELEEEELNVVPENLPIDVVYEDDDLIVVNKPAGLVVHPSKGHPTGTLVNRLVYHFDQLSQAESIRPGIVHRIDKDTTGLLVVAKNNFTHRGLAEQLEQKTMRRTYILLAYGNIETDQGIIKVPLRRDERNRFKFTGHVDGKEAITHFKVLQRLEGATLVEAQLETGRTHQIRAHFEYINHPIIGDPVYNQTTLTTPRQFKKLSNTQLLHARDISFIHPRSNQTMTFTSSLPDAFAEAYQQILSHHSDSVL